MGGLELLPDDGAANVFGKRISDALKSLVSEVPASQEVTMRAPELRAKALADSAAIKAALISGGMAIVPGPGGILTIIPALIKIWQIQRQLVADIAAVYGKTAELQPRMMLYCLFRHGSATVFKETVVQVGGRLLVRQASLQAIQQLIQKISFTVTQRVISQFLSRWVPVVGSAAIGTFTYWDTKRIGRTAIDTFSKEIESETPNLPAIPRS